MKTPVVSGGSIPWDLANRRVDLAETYLAGMVSGSTSTRTRGIHASAKRGPGLPGPLFDVMAKILPERLPSWGTRHAANSCLAVWLV